MSLAILIPVLGRPERAQPVADAFAETTACEHRIMFICSQGDEEEIDACRATHADVAVTSFPAGQGDWAKKINLGWFSTDEDLILLGADDLEPQPDWDKPVLEVFSTLDVGVIGTNDDGNPTVQAGRHSTHPVVARCYVDAHGTIDGMGIAHEGYWHNWVDSEIIETAKARGCWHFCGDSHVTHMHPFWHKAKDDETYRRGREHYDEDRRLFLRRRQLWGRRSNLR